MSRPATIVPIVTWKPETADTVRAKGMPLPALWDAVFRFVWAAKCGPKSNQNRSRTRALSVSLSDHPSPPEVLGWMAALRGMGYGEDTVDHHRKNLAALYKYGADLGLSSGNPAALAPHGRPKGKPCPILDIAAKWPLFLDVCADARERAFIGVMRFAGLRRGEALGLRLDDVNTYATPWRLEVVRQRPDPARIDHTPPKTESSCRYLPVRGPLQQLLAPVLQLGRPEIRVGKGGGRRRVVDLLFPYRTNDLEDLIARLRQVDPLAFPEGHKAWHALRDTVSVEMHRKGKTTAQVAELLGHGSEYTTRHHYLSVFGREVHTDVTDGLDGPAPPGAGPPPDVPAAEKWKGSDGQVGAPPRRSQESRPTITKESTPCHTSTRSDSSQQGRSAATTGGRSPRSFAPPSSPAQAASPSTRKRSSRTSSGSPPSRPRAATPATSPSPAGSPRTQRALPGLSVGPVTRRPRR